VIDNSLGHVNSDIRTAVVSGQKKMMSEIMNLENKMSLQISDLTNKMSFIEEKVGRIGKGNYSQTPGLEVRTSGNLLSNASAIEEEASQNAQDAIFSAFDETPARNV
jgi:hypothetical protein